MFYFKIHLFTHVFISRSSTSVILLITSQNANVEDVRKWREAEIKHGRLAMLAALGIVVGEEVEFSTPLFGDMVTGPAIYQFQEADQLTGYGFAGLIVGLIALIEVSSIGRAWESFEQKMQRDSNAAGSQLAPGYVNGDLGMSCHRHLLSNLLQDDIALTTNYFTLVYFCLSFQYFSLPPNLNQTSNHRIMSLSLFLMQDLIL